MEIIEKISQLLNRVLIILGGVLLTCMILLICSNILLRQIWVPILGTYELMGYSGAIVTAFALGYTQKLKGHIAVDILVNLFSKKTNRILNGISSLLCLGFSVIATWQFAKKAGILWKTGEVTESLRIIYYPFIYAVAFGCAVLSLVLLIDLVKSFIHE